MADEEGDGGGKVMAPPYTAFLTVKNLIGLFKEHGCPGQIDRSVLTSMSGAVQGQVLAAMKFLGLIGINDNVPRSPLKQLIEAHGTDDWASALADVLRTAFAPLFQLNLETASPNQFNEQFRNAYPSIEGETARKSITFFLNAARDANISISPYIMKNKKPRTASPKRKISSRKPREREVNDGASGVKEEGDVNSLESRSAYQVLMEDIYDPADMEAGSDEEKAVFVLARYLKIKETHD